MTEQENRIRELENELAKLKSAAPLGTEAEVCKDIAQRQRFGIRKYGRGVRENPLTPDQWDRHLYEELLDAVVYMKRRRELVSVAVHLYKDGDKWCAHMPAGQNGDVVGAGVFGDTRGDALRLLADTLDRFDAVGAGVPIFINQHRFLTTKETIQYEKIVALAGAEHGASPSVTWKAHLGRLGVATGILLPGKTADVIADMSFYVANTSQA